MRKQTILVTFLVRTKDSRPLYSLGLYRVPIGQLKAIEEEAKLEACYTDGITELVQVNQNDNVNTFVVYKIKDNDIYEVDSYFINKEQNIKMDNIMKELSNNRETHTLQYLNTSKQLDNLFLTIEGRELID